MINLLIISSKICSNCKVEKALEDYYKYSRSKDGLSYWCKFCNNTYVKKWESRNKSRRLPKLASWRREYNKQHPDKTIASNRTRNLKYKYNLTEDEYIQILQKQAEVCAICRQHETSIEGNSGKIRKLTVDHCHKTGKIRGLLCNKCNLGLGHFKDNAELLQIAICYLGEANGSL